MNGDYYRPEVRLEFDERRARAEYEERRVRADMERKRRERALRREEERRRAARTLGCLLLSCLLAAVVLAAVLVWPRTAKELTVEAGTALPEAQDFVRGGFFHAEIVNGLYEAGDSTVLGDRVVKLSIAGRERTAVVHVEDTIPPAVETRNLSLVNATEVFPEDFVAAVQDATETETAFVQTPDLSGSGTQEVHIAVTDAAGNRTEAAAQLELTIDNTPPVIEGTGVLSVVMGGTVSYKKGVTVTDDQDPSPALEVDNSQVNLKVPGTYRVTYTATDFAGNQSEKTIDLQVTTPLPADVTQETLDMAADNLLAEITTPDMSQYEAAKAIYKWCHGRIAYVDSSEKDNWILAAWQGIMKRQGDCYTYCMTAKELLTRAGIENRLIERIRKGNSMHFWNLIDIGEGWHHFDTTPRAGNPPSFFYLTDSELMAYSNAHRGTHNYDRTIYTDIVP